MNASCLAAAACLCGLSVPHAARAGGPLGIDHPAVYALALLPAYDAVARVKTRGHWQSDVLAGAAVGVALGVYAHHRAKPLFLGFTPDGSGVMVGYAKAF